MARFINSSRILFFNFCIASIAPLAAILAISQDNHYPVISIFSPGFFEKGSISTRQAARYAKNHILHGTYAACTYNDTHTTANFGQDEDINILAQQYQGCCNANPNTRIILAGISRGASALFNFIGKKKPKNIAAVIAESPFATIDDIIDYIISQWYISWVPGIRHITLATLKLLYPSYNVNGIQPITSIQSPLSAPILIVCSKQDTVVPYTSSVRLAHELKKKGHDVYLLIFTQGAHGFLSYKEEFQQVVNALYARYNLPHDAQLAHQGMPLLEGCRL